MKNQYKDERTKNIYLHVSSTHLQVIDWDTFLKVFTLLILSNSLCTDTREQVLSLPDCQQHRKRGRCRQVGLLRPRHALPRDAVRLQLQPPHPVRQGLRGAARTQR